MKSEQSSPGTANKRFKNTISNRVINAAAGDRRYTR